jgi:predicted enzyme related to lactoylglutathione lyase
MCEITAKGRIPMPRVVHFEINADDPARASKFYSGVFGWKINKWDGPMDYWLVDTGENEPGINGGVTKRMNPQATSVNTVGVDNLDSFIKKVEAAGGKIVAPKMAIPGMGWLAYATDSEGNMFGMMQPDENAK